MTVQELIDELECCDPDAPVEVHGDCATAYGIEKVIDEDDKVTIVSFVG